MRKFLSRIISKIKGQDWDFDSNISITALLRTFFTKSIMYVRGILIFFRFKPLILIGKKVTVLSKSKIKISGNISIDKYCHIDATSEKGINFGSNVSIGKYTTIECTGTLKYIGVGLIVGNDVGMGTNGFFGCAGGVKIGNDTIFGNYVSIHAENHNFQELDVPIRLQGVNRLGVEIGNDCWIGAKVTILDGVKIGNGCIVAAGAVVVKGEYPDYSIIGGLPAKIISSRK